MEWSQYDFLLSLKIYEKYLQSLEPHHINVLARESWLQIVKKQCQKYHETVSLLVNRRNAF